MNTWSPSARWISISTSSGARCAHSDASNVACRRASPRAVGLERVRRLRLDVPFVGSRVDQVDGPEAARSLFDPAVEQRSDAGGAIRSLRKRSAQALRRLLRRVDEVLELRRGDARRERDRLGRRAPHPFREQQFDVAGPRGAVLVGAGVDRTGDRGGGPLDRCAPAAERINRPGQHGAAGLRRILLVLGRVGQVGDDARCGELDEVTARCHGSTPRPPRTHR